MELLSASETAPEVIETFSIIGSLEGSASGTLADVGKALEEDIPAGGLDGKVTIIERGTITFRGKG